MTTALVPKVHEGEIVGVDDCAPSARVRVVACPRPFSVERVEFFATPGATIDDLIRQAGVPDGYPVRVFIDDWQVMPEWWAVTRPRPGSVVTIRAIAYGGGGGGNSKNIGSIILGIVLIVVGIVLLYTVWGAPAGPYFISAGVGLTLGGVINLIVGPPKIPKLGALAGLSQGAARVSPTFAISGTRNAARPYEKVPKLFGSHRIFPPTGVRMEGP